MGSAEALEVIGAFVEYRGDGRCPACDGKVIEAILRENGPDLSRSGFWTRYKATHYLCTVCQWSIAIPPIDYGASFEFIEYDRDIDSARKR